MRTINIYWDTVLGRHLNASGFAIRRDQWPVIHYTEKAMINLRLVTDSDLTPYTELGASADVYSAVVDNEFNNTTSDYVPMVETLDADFNQAGDFEDSDGQAVPSLGELSFPLDGDTVAFDDKVGTSEEVEDAFCELKVSDGADVVFVFQMGIRTRNIITS